MNVRALQCFIKVYEKKSINAAAKEVYMSPQGLSKVIKQLEIDLDAELFSRGFQGMEATPSGELLYARARHICYLMEDIKKEIGVINGESGALNVAMTYSAAMVIPLDFIAGLAEAAPGLQIHIKEYPDEYLIEDVLQEEADVGLIMGNEGMKDCHYETILSGEIVLAVRPSHTLAKKDSASLRDLAGESLALKTVKEDKEHRLIEKAGELGLSLRAAYESGNFFTLHRLCKEAGMVAVSVDFIEKAIADEGVKILRLKEKIPEHIYLVTRDQEIQKRSIAVFRNFLVDRIKGNKAR